MKKVFELFDKALKDGSSIRDLDVLEVKFSKKENSAAIAINIDKKINPIDFLDFESQAEEKYLLKGFQINTKVNIKEDIILDVEDVKNVLKYYEEINTCSKDMFKDSCIEITKEEIKILLALPNSSFLKLKKADKKLIEITKKFFNKTQIYIIEDSLESEERYNEIVKKRININTQEISHLNKENKSNSKDFKKSFEPNKSKETGFKTIVVNADSSSKVIVGKDLSSEKICKIENISEDMNFACIEGKVEKIEYKQTKTGKTILMLNVSDSTSTICCKMFLDAKKISILKNRLEEKMYVKVLGRAAYDMYAKELGIMITAIMEAQKPKEREDLSTLKRVELHVHTQMSAMDGVSSAKSIVEQAINFGHSAIAITDHGVAQSFPEANMAAINEADNTEKIKVIYGLEGYLISDVDIGLNLDKVYTVFDIETTGFHAGVDKITEIAAVKLKDGKVIDKFSTFVNPERPIPKDIQELTHITEEDVKNAPKVEKVMKDFVDFAKGTIVVAHNAKFDMSFIQYFCKKNDIEPPKYIIDTLSIAREIFEEYENHKLGTIAENLNIDLGGAHRAINDVLATSKIFLVMCEVLKTKDIEINDFVQTNFTEDMKDTSPNHIIILAKDYVGLKNLYKIISFSHIRFFHKKPRIPRSLLNRYRKGLIIGSACERGEVFQAVLNKEEGKDLNKVASYYDYLEIQPIGNNMFYLKNETLKDEEELKDINRKIISLGKDLNIPVAATCDVHFLNPEDEIYRRIIMSGLGYEDADKQAPLYLRTTEEMLNEFEYLGKEVAREVVITNTNKIADLIESIRPVVSGTYNPEIEGSDEEIEKMTLEKAKAIYGDILPEIVEARIKKELTAIIKHGFSVMYLIAQKLVKKSNDDGYLVGSRGSVGSSLVATMTGITEVNPLPAHYLCEKCQYSEFPNLAVTTGVDLVDKLCPNCETQLKKDGMDIPFETFLGFKGNKVPDIDLNFSGEYQAKAHAHTEILFGKSKTFRAGTISTLADKTAYGFVKKYFESKNKYVLMPEINRIASKCTGIKKTTGQHPGGIIVLPKNKEIYDFCPVQRPADDMRTKTTTTHFDFHSIHDNLLKLDILGHDDPTIIKILEDLTGVSAKTIPLDEPKVMSIFSSTTALGVNEEQINSKVGTFAVPEFGTKFVRQMLIDTKPKTFGELVRISGVSHGTDVWLGNAQELIKSGKTTLSNAICTRDDIMIYLIQMGLDPATAFKIMEIVRKGKSEKLLTNELQEAMREKDVPEWYIDSCKKIKYMFPKAHAAAYVMMAYRIAYYKVYFPKAFYAAYYTVRANTFTADLMCRGKQKVKDTIKEYETNPASTQTEKDLITILEVVNEMLERDVIFLPIDIYISDATKFLVEDEGIRPPLASIPGFGGVNALNVIKARLEGKFSSVENLAARAHLGKMGIELLDKYGCLKKMPKSSQVSMFDTN